MKKLLKCTLRPVLDVLLLFISSWLKDRKDGRKYKTFLDTEASLVKGTLSGAGDPPEAILSPPET